MTSQTTPPAGVLPTLSDAQRGGREALLQVLENLIVGGTWPAGTKLPSERALCQHFGLSRPVVREALRRLEERGLIEVHAARGSFVLRLSAADATRRLDTLYRRTGVTARQLVVARTMLECESAALAATNATSEAREQIREVLAAHERAEDLDHRARLDVAFHEAIARASGNPVLHIMFSSIRPLVLGLVLRSLSDRKIRQVGEPYHGKILDAILAGDAETARAAMLEHITLALSFYGDDLDQPLAQVLADRSAMSAEVAQITHQLAELG
jgi:GntR family transcriptional repressor for pyruvate dehydrogenase complex